MTKYKYYLLDNGAGVPHEIYRSTGNIDFLDARLWRAKKNGTWSESDSDITLACNLAICGDFVPDDSEITEEEAMAYLAEWRSSNGKWPGRE